MRPFSENSTSSDGSGPSQLRASRRAALAPPRRASGWRTLALAILAVGVATCARVAPDTPSPEALERLDLGGYSMPITSADPEVQTYFDQGLLLTYGFNHDAAVRAFRHAAALDPACAMCRWGEALALGPNINAPMGADAGRAAHAAIRDALERAETGADAKERALIEALALRYEPEPPVERAHLDRRYALAMREVQARYPGDVDIKVLTAEALMDLSPWNYWDADAEPRAFTLEVLALLESAMDQTPEHVGANHYYIHATEEYIPEKAEAAADRLGAVAPDAGHLVHMPSHIYWRVGRYADAVRTNELAAAADERFFGWCRPGAFYRALYYPHNVHFLWAAASAEGRRDLALTAARKLAASVRDQVEEWPLVEEFLAVPTLTLARFGEWDAILAVPRPDPGQVYVTGIWHYARGLAHLRRGAPEAARAEFEALRAATERPEAEGLMLAGGTASARRLLEIGQAHLAGELSAAAGARGVALVALRKAVAEQDALVYMEPPPWYFPVRQALGAVLLDQGKYAEAEEVYREDLEQYPKNGWSLFGLAESLERQGRVPEAEWARRGHHHAFARADVELRASRF